MKKITLLLTLLLNVVISSAQDTDDTPPVTWKVEANQSRENPNQYELIFYAKIAEGYHLYANELPSKDSGPLPTEFEFIIVENVEFIGGITEGSYETEMDESFQVEVNYYVDEAIFKQKIQVEDTMKRALVEGKIHYMVCNDTMCIPLEYTFRKMIQLSK